MSAYGCHAHLSLIAASYYIAIVTLEDVNSYGIKNLAVIRKGGYTCIIINIQCVFLKESPQIHWISVTGEVRLLYTSIVRIVEMEDMS